MSGTAEKSFVIWRFPPGMFVLILLGVVSLIFAAWDSVAEMVRRWGDSEEYGYAYIIPFITLYFVWSNSGKLQKHRVSPSYVGLLGLLLGLLLIMLGTLSATHSIAQYGFVISLLGLSLSLIGWMSFKYIAGPMLLLFLMVPLPAFVFNNLSAELQLISSQIGVAVIRAFGISVFLEGNVIDLGRYQLQVVEACSGLRYLFPLISLSIIAAFMYRAAMWKRIIVVLSSIPITVLMNSFRIGVIGVLVEYYGVEQAEGFLHDFEGWIVFMACVGLLLLEMWILVAFGRNKQSLSDVFAIEFPEPLPGDAEFKSQKIGWQHFFITGLVVVASLYIGTLNEREEIVPARNTFASFPLQFDGWGGRRGSIEKIYLDELKLNDYIIADYTRDNNTVVNMYLAYYESQRSGAAAHSPRSCIPGGGWRITSHEVITVPGTGKPANRLFIQKGDEGQLVYYWFEQRGRVITNEYLVKWYLFWDSMTKGRTDGALVRLTTRVRPGEDVSKADARLTEFAQLMDELLPAYIPE